LRTITVSARYAVTAPVLWAHVVRYDSLQNMMSGVLVRVRCPEGEERPGHDVTLVFRLFDFIPVGRWRFKVLARDDEERRLLSEEGGTGVRYWRHEIKIEDEGEGARLTDTITIDAGVMTSLVTAFARRDYRRRHRLRARMLA
jgi:ligand-binding SRPBCC domain-containing protein